MSETISAIASLLWPLIVLVLFVVFRGPLSRVIRSAEQRDFTIKIAGQEVSVGELSRQQMDLIADLQEKVSALSKQVAGVAPGSANHTADTAQPAEPAAEQPVEPIPDPLPALELPVVEPQPVPVGASDGAGAGQRPVFAVDSVKAPWERLELPPAPEPEPVSPLPALEPAANPNQPAAVNEHAWVAQLPDTRPKPAGMLWVDDHPERHILQLDHLERRGVVIDLVRGTKEALQKLTGQRYQVIVTSLERVENGQPVPDAGLELLRTVRSFDHDTPIVIYGTGPALKHYGEKARQAGADLVTGSGYELSEQLRRIGVL